MSRKFLMLGIALGVVLLAILSHPALAAKKKPAAPPAETLQAPAPPAEPRLTFRSVYRAILEVGPIDELKTRIPPGATLIKSADNRTGYLVKAIPVESAEQLVRLMGAESEDGLTDGQKGLLASYRFSQSPVVREYTPYFPYPAATFTIELNDTTGFEDPARFPTVREDFWPRNSRSYMTLGGKPVSAEFTICMSPIATLGFGDQTAAQMRSTMVHELAHSLDLIHAETDAYGKDGSHFFNERITERAAFQEGFADFGQFMLDPGLVDQYRQTLRKIKLEGPEGYTQVDPTDPTLPGSDLLRVEGVVALTMVRFAQSIPDGRKKILEAFRASNAQDNSFPRFLKAFADRNPDSVASMAAALDAETHGRLSAEQLRTLLGPSAALEAYLGQRPGPDASGQAAASSSPTLPIANPGDGVTSATAAIREPIRVGGDGQSPFASGD